MKHMAPQNRRTHVAAFAALLALVMLLGGGLALWRLVLRPQPTAQANAPSSDQMTTPDGPEEKDSAMTDHPTTASPTPDPSAEAEPNARLKAMLDAGEVGSIRLIGDSITAGYCTDGFADPYVVHTDAVAYDDGWDTHFEPTIEANDWANAFRSYAAARGVGSFVNAGIGGWFMRNLAQNPDAWIREGADVIFVALGTNDAGYYGPDEYREDARTALSAVANRCKLVVVVSPVSDLRDPATLVEPAASLKDVLRPLCEEGGYAFVDASGVCEPEQFAPDGLHPNTQGSLAIWGFIQQALGLD